MTAIAAPMLMSTHSRVSHCAYSNSPSSNRRRNRADTPSLWGRYDQDRDDREAIMAELTHEPC